MDSGKRDLNPSSLLDLKAELLKKQEEVKNNKGPQKTSQRAKTFRKTSVWNKKNAGVLERAQRDLEQKKEEDDELERSRKQLEAKTRLYEAMTRVSHPDDIPAEDGGQRFLVDFEQKGVRSLSDLKRQERRHVEEMQSKEVLNDSNDAQDIDGMSEIPEEEQWVDYVDKFGRSRRCMKKDLPSQDAKNQQPSKSVLSGTDLPQKELMSADMQRELVRQKWEEHERLTASNPDDPIHYANVQYNEIRTHGTGYYQFAKTEEEREKQLEALREIREQTKETRAKREKVQDRKKAIMKERLLKVKRRKLIREGKNPDDISEDLTSSDDDGLIGPSVSEKDQTSKEPDLLRRDEEARKAAPTREWDVGKKEEKWFGEERWLEDRRNERVADFAPPQMYNDIGTSHTKSQNTGSKGTRRVGAIPQKGHGYSSTKSQNSQMENPINKNRTGEGGAFATSGIKSMERVETSKSNINPMAALEERLVDADDTSKEDTVMDVERELVGGVIGNSKDPMAALEKRLFEHRRVGKHAERKGGNIEVDLIGQGLREIRSEVEGKQNVTGQGMTSLNSDQHVTRLSTVSMSEQGSPNSQDIVNIPLPSNTNISEEITLKEGFSSDSKRTSSNLLPRESAYDQYYAQQYGYGTAQDIQSGYQYPGNNYPESFSAYPASSVEQTQYSNNTGDNMNNLNTVVPTYTNTCINPLPSEDGKASTTVSETVTTEAQTRNGETSAKMSKAPQPAHFSAAPQKAEPRRSQVKYQRVNLYDIPDELPAPIASNNVPEYPSMQEILGSRSEKNKPPLNEEKQIKAWHRQFQGGQKSNTRSDGGIERVKHANIPFVSPYVQSKEDTTDRKNEVAFDPSKPPPGSDK